MVTQSRLKGFTDVNGSVCTQSTELTSIVDQALKHQQIIVTTHSNVCTVSSKNKRTLNNNKEVVKIKIMDDQITIFFSMIGCGPDQNERLMQFLTCLYLGLNRPQCASSVLHYKLNQRARGCTSNHGYIKPVFVQDRSTTNKYFHS